MNDIDTEWSQFLEVAPRVTEKQIELFHTFDISLQQSYLSHFEIETIEEMYRHDFSKILRMTYKSNNLTRKQVVKEMKDRIKDPLGKLKRCFPNHEIIQKIETFEQGMNQLTDYEIKQLTRKIPELYLPNTPKALSIYPVERVLQYTPHYEIGIQTKNEYEMKYIKFYDWGTFDYDISCSQSIILGFLEKIVEKVPDCCFLVYETNRGYHVHIMNELIDYKSERFRHLSHMMNSDPWYTNFVSHNGYKLRISLKPNDTFIAKFCKMICGKEGIIHKQCELYQKIYERYIYQVSST